MLALLGDVPTTIASPESAANFTWLLVKMMIVLGVVGALAFIILKYLTPRIGVLRRAGTNQYIHIVARRALDPKKHVWIVRVGARHFLLGSADGAVTSLAELQASDVQAGDQS